MVDNGTGHRKPSCRLRGIYWSQYFKCSSSHSIQLCLGNDVIHEVVKIVKRKIKVFFKKISKENSCSFKEGIGSGAAPRRVDESV